MIWFALGKWSSSSGRFFIRERLYYLGRWTPLIKVSFRYLKTVKESMKGKEDDPPNEEN